MLPSNEQAPRSVTIRPLEPHALGSVLVSAVFEALVTVAKRKTGAAISGYCWSRSTRALGEVALSEALVRALAQEASDLASQFLNICIRAIDYCPPADMEFGEYLRALITADGDMEATDKWGVREALMRSFRRREIFPNHVPFMTEDAVRWQPPDVPLRIAALAFKNLRFDGEPGRPATAQEMERQARVLGRFVTNPAHAKHFHLVAADAPLPKGITQASPAMVESVRVSRRATPDGRVLFDLVAEVTQTCTVDFKGAIFEMNGGCTVIIDPQGEVRYVHLKTLRERGAPEHGNTLPCVDRLKRSGKNQARVTRSNPTSCAGSTHCRRRYFFLPSPGR